MTATPRLIVVTGATRGIGRATALAFAASGAHVVVHGRHERDAARVAEEVRAAGGQATTIMGDLCDPDACATLVQKAADLQGHIDVLVNNAGANAFYGIRETTLAQWEDCMNLDLRASWLCAKAAAAVMPRGGSIINITSNHARATLPGSFPYNVAKAGAEALTTALAIDLASDGIRVNAVAPGYVDTPINDAYFATFADPAAARTSANGLHLTGRLAYDYEIASAIEFLADPWRSASTTGTVLTIDGGRAALLEDRRPQGETA